MSSFRICMSYLLALCFFLCSAHAQVVLTLEEAVEEIPVFKEKAADQKPPEGKDKKKAPKVEDEKALALLFWKDWQGLKQLIEKEKLKFPSLLKLIEKKGKGFLLFPQDIIAISELAKEPSIKDIQALGRIATSPGRMSHLDGLVKLLLQGTSHFGSDSYIHKKQALQLLEKSNNFSLMKPFLPSLEQIKKKQDVYTLALLCRFYATQTAEEQTSANQSEILNLLLSLDISKLAIKEQQDCAKAFIDLLNREKINPQ